MRKLRVFGVLTLLVIIITACSPHREVQDGIISANQRVEMVLDTYKEFKESIIPLEGGIIRFLDERNYEELIEIMEEHYNDKLRRDLPKVLSLISESIDSYINQVEDLATDQESFNTEEEVARGTPVERIEDRTEFIMTVIDMHRFIDDSTGKTEHMVIVRLPNGFIGGVVTHWLGGVYIDFETFGYN